MERNFHIISGRQPRQKERQNIPVGYEQKVISNSAVGFASIPLNANRAVIMVENKTVRWRIDGIDPTDSVGTKSFAGTVIILENRTQIDNFRAIRTSIDAKLSVHYYERK